MFQLGFDAESLLKVGGGTGVLGAIVLLVRHFFATGTERLQERRHNAEDAGTRAAKWEGEWKTCEKGRLLELRRRDRLMWAYDDLLKSALQMCGLVKEEKEVPAYLTEEIEALPDAKTLLEAVKIDETQAATDANSH